VSRSSAPGRLGATVLVASVVLLATGGAAAAASAPTATTGPVTAVGPTTATFAGKVTPNGLATTWYLEYGTSTGYGSKTSTHSAGSGTTSVDVTTTLSGLAPGTSYHYRIVATNSAGTGRGADGIFSTAAPPAAETGSATDVTTTSAKLNGTVDPNGRATSWYFEFGTSTGYGTKTPEKSAGAGTSAAGVSVPVTGLARGRLYHFRLVATSDAGTARGADRTLSTSGAPDAVTGSASAVTPTTAKLSGAVTPNGRSTSWYFEYGTSTSYGSKTSSRGAGSGTSAVAVSSSLSRLNVATTYHYRLVARNDSGTTVGGDRSFSTSLPPDASTGAPQNVGPSTATATGSVDPRGRQTTWYFEYGTSTSYGSRTSAQSAGAGTTRRGVSASLSRLVSATIYHYRLVAASDAGTSRGADATFTTAGVTLTAPAAPVVFGRSISLSGTVPTRQARETVTVFAQRYGESSFASVATVLTGDGGAWTYLAQPGIQTTYKAGWSGGLSAPTIVGVRPAVSFRRLATGRFSTRVAARHSFAGRYVQLQRRTASGGWRTVKRVRLNARSATRFRAPLPRGRSVLRIAFSINQAGAGYLGGVSRTMVYRRT
jgi:hypothetical protein